MTRSSAKRRNRNARMIVAALTGRDILRTFVTDGPFHADSARRFVMSADEVNFQLCAELLNRKARWGLEREVRLVNEIVWPTFDLTNLPQKKEGTIRSLYARSTVTLKHHGVIRSDTA